MFYVTSGHNIKDILQKLSEMLFEIEIRGFSRGFCISNNDSNEVIMQQPREQVLYFYSTMATK